MCRVNDNADWTLCCSNEAYDTETSRRLVDVWGDKVKRLCARLKAGGKGHKAVKAQQLWFRILKAQMEAGTPHMPYQDQANLESNQQNLGAIHSSNLGQWSSSTRPRTRRSCATSSIALPPLCKPREKPSDLRTRKKDAPPANRPRRPGPCIRLPDHAAALLMRGRQASEQ